MLNQVSSRYVRFFVYGQVMSGKVGVSG